MPRSIPPSLLTAIESNASTLCELFLVTRSDSTQVAFTSHTEDLQISDSDGSILYRARPGVRVSRASSNMFLEIDNAQAEGYFRTGVVGLTDFLALKYDGATVKRKLYDWSSGNNTTYTVQSGHIGRIEVADQAFRVEIRSLAHALSQTVGETLSRTCTHKEVGEVGDFKCNASLAGKTFSLSISGIVNSRHIQFGGTTPAAGELEYGTAVWTSGNNFGIKSEIQVHVAVSQLVFVEPPPYQMVVGDAFTATKGCDRSATRCSNEFNNLVNFRGFPALIGNDYYRYGDQDENY